MGKQRKQGLKKSAAANVDKGQRRRSQQKQQNRQNQPISLNQPDLQDKLDALQEKLQAEANSLQLFVEEVRVRQNPLTLEIVVDKTEGTDPVDLELVAEFSRLVSTVLDRKENDPLPVAYLLEVTTRGAEALLTKPRHYARNVGRLIRIKLLDGTKITGRLCQALETEFQIETEKFADSLFVEPPSDPLPTDLQTDPLPEPLSELIKAQTNRATVTNQTDTTSLLTIEYAKVSKARPLVEMSLESDQNTN